MILCGDNMEIGGGGVGGGDGYPPLNKIVRQEER